MTPTIRYLAGLMTAATIAAWAVPAVAQEERHAADARAVVELFTSQGCSSCPPADAALADMATRPDLVTLAYHVDYWNYLGWKDTLSSPENTARQKSYAAALGNKSVYTPQAVVNGQDHVNGGDRRTLDAMIGSFSDSRRGLDVDVSLVAGEEDIRIRVGPGAGKANVLFVTFTTRSKVDVAKGENAGRRIAYVNAVREIQTVGKWSGTATEIVLPAMLVDFSANQGCAVLVQTMGKGKKPGRIRGAAMLR